MTFAQWQRGMGEHISELAGCTQDEWATLFRELDDDIEDTVLSPDPGHPEQHLGFLAWLAQHAPPAFVARRLAWLSNTVVAGAPSAETWGDVTRVSLRLEPKVAEQLEAMRLVVLERPRPS